MTLPDGTSLDVIELTNEQGHVQGKLHLTAPNGATLDAWIDFAPMMQVTAGAVGPISNDRGGIGVAKGVAPPA